VTVVGRTDLRCRRPAGATQTTSGTQSEGGSTGPTIVSNDGEVDVEGTITARYEVTVADGEAVRIRIRVRVVPPGVESAPDGFPVSAVVTGADGDGRIGADLHPSRVSLEPVDRYVIAGRGTCVANRSLAGSDWPRTAPVNGCWIVRVGPSNGPATDTARLEVASAGHRRPPS
jgi:hypothetical protein